MPHSRTHASGTQAQRRTWRRVLPWLVLPVALALIALVDWLRHGRNATHEEEAR